MSPSALASSWVAAHLKQRGLPCDVVSTNSSAGRQVEKKPPLPIGRPQPVEPKPPEKHASTGELLAALGHCMASQSVDGSKPVSNGLADASNNEPGNSLKGEKSAKEHHRITPQGTISSIVRLVEQQEHRAACGKGSAHAVFLLNTVLTTSVRHALHGSALEHSPGNDARMKAISDTFIVPPAQQVSFPWSVEKAATHLNLVFQDGAVQRRLRSRLWKTVSKEHKHITENVDRLLCESTTHSEAGTVASKFGVTEEELRGLFDIPGEGIVAACDLLRALYTDVDRTPPILDEERSKEPGRLVSFLSECHFTYKTSSRCLAELLTRRVRMPVEGKKTEGSVKGKTEVTGESYDATFVQEMSELLMDMSRVRMAVAALLEFEILARRYTNLKKKQVQGELEGAVQAEMVALAQEVCTLAMLTASRVMEAQLHRKRFVALFHITVRCPPILLEDKEGGGDVAAGPRCGTEHTHYSTVKSVFAALSATSTSARGVAGAEKATPLLNPCDRSSFPSSTSPCSSEGMNANVPLPSSDDSTARLTHSCDKHAVTNSLLMAELMSVAPVSGNSVKREGDEQNNNKKRRVDESRNEEVSQALQGLSCLSEHGKWKFRSCRMPGNDFLNPVSATPCGKKDAKVQLLRPSKEVPWPFTLDVVSSPVNSSSDQDGRLHGKCVDDGDAHASFHSSGAGDFISAVAEKEVRMCFDRSWLYGSSPSTADDGKVPSNSATATGPFPTTLSTVDLRHVMQFQRLLEFHGGRLLSLNGCPSHKLDPIRSIARNALRLIVRFR